MVFTDALSQPANTIIILAGRQAGRQAGKGIVLFF
jgi:hypothetical protein